MTENVYLIKAYDFENLEERVKKMCKSELFEEYARVNNYMAYMNELFENGFISECDFMELLSALDNAIVAISEELVCYYLYENGYRNFGRLCVKRSKLLNVRGL